ncbi:MAG: GNAT family N-acetyltransferase [Anaerolineae bacterium]|nr:GNAT family N-acetyltransferase [Thermoflexales bacterium]MDW8406962.1 GNAT family N-acetyltransferase [Anaerolineae bacterium]
MSPSHPSNRVAERLKQEIGLISDYGGRALAELSTQRRVFNHMDWWTVEDWFGSDAFIAVGQAGRVNGAMLVAPAVFDDINRLDTARCDVAWLRWCALRNGVPAAPVLRQMFDASCAVLRRVGVNRLMCAVELSCWLVTYLRALGLQREDDVVTLLLERAEWTIPRTHPVLIDCVVRSANLFDVAGVLEVDHSAFEPLWRLPADVPVRALQDKWIFWVGQCDDRLTGYVLANQLDHEAHIARLAVHSDYQRRGIGAALLADVLTNLFNVRRARTVTLNTQASNTAALNLYNRFGFRPLEPLVRVFRVDLPSVTNCTTQG